LSPVTKLEILHMYPPNDPCPTPYPLLPWHTIPREVWVLSRTGSGLGWAFPTRGITREVAYLNPLAPEQGLAELSDSIIHLLLSVSLLVNYCVNYSFPDENTGKKN